MTSQSMTFARIPTPSSTKCLLTRLAPNLVPNVFEEQQHQQPKARFPSPMSIFLPPQIRSQLPRPQTQLPPDLLTQVRPFLSHPRTRRRVLRVAMDNLRLSIPTLLIPQILPRQTTSRPSSSKKSRIHHSTKNLIIKLSPMSSTTSVDWKRRL